MVNVEPCELTAKIFRKNTAQTFLRASAKFLAIVKILRELWQHIKQAKIFTFCHIQIHELI